MRQLSMSLLVCLTVWSLSADPLRALDDPVLHVGASVELSTPEFRFEPLFSGSLTDCGKLRLALNSRSIPHMYLGNGLGGAISVLPKNWDHAAILAEEINLTVLRASLVEAIQLFFSREFSRSYDLASSKLLELDHDACGADFLTVMEQSRRRMALVRNRLRPISNREWTEVMKSSSRVHALQQLASMIPLAPGEVDEEQKVVPACRKCLNGPDIPETIKGYMDAPMDPLLQIWRMAPEPDELYVLCDSLAFDWILLPTDLNADMTPALSPCTRQFIIEVFNRSIGTPDRINVKSLSDEQWRDPSKILAIVFSKENGK